MVDAEAAGEIRDRLTAGELFGEEPSSLVENRYFLPMGEISSAEHRLSGTLHFSETRMVTTHPDSDWKGSGQSVFPTFSIPVVSHEGHFIPLERRIIYSGEEATSFWNIIVSPGKVWKESTDNGYSRASFPFVLTDNAIGQARNGVATFVFNSGEISDVAIQITQETAPAEEYIRTEFHARVPVRYEPEEFPDADYWLMLKKDVLDPLHVGHLPLTRTREANGELGTPIMGWGSYPNVHEAAKIGKLLQDEGNLHGRQVLSRAKVRDALFRTPYRGYEAGGTDRYLHSVWLVSVLASPCTVGVPTMAGHGGNYVLLIPSGLTAIRFSDADSYAVAPMVRAVERYLSSCW